MAVDWDAVSDAIRLGKPPKHAAEALELLASVEPNCESNRDRAAICNSKAMCFAHLGNFQAALAQIQAAKEFAGTERDLMLQIDLAEAATRGLTAEHQTACDLYERIEAKYGDLLSEDPESVQEFDERYGYALVHVERYEDAVPIFQRLLKSGSIEGEQRVRLYLGTAFAESGHWCKARNELELATKGPDPTLAKDALACLASTPPLCSLL